MTTQTTPAFDVHPSDARGRTELGWLHSWHSFSFGQHHDPQRMQYRALRVINDDIIEPGGGFGEHGHRDMEILTWVLRGELAHSDSLGHEQSLRPGELQAMTAGRGIRHAEYNGSDTEQVHLLQIWLLPDRAGHQPRYQQRAFRAEGRHNQWQTVADGRPGASTDALPIHQDAAMRVTQLDAGATLDLTVASGRHAYVHVATGEVAVEQATLRSGDALSTREGVAGSLTLRAVEPAQVLWFDLA